MRRKENQVGGRVIKFRAWDEERKVMCRVMSLTDSEQTPFMLVRYPGKEISEARPREVLKVMEFTGLHEKNGKEIWEGDIVKGPMTMHPNGRSPKKKYFILEVKWCGDFFWGWILSYGKQNIGDYRTFPNWNEVEVLGNIYENPELMK